MKAASVVVLLAAALAVTGSASATCLGPPEVELLPTGPSPSTLTVTAGASIMFRKSSPEGESRVRFDGAACTLDYLELTPCAFTVPAGGFVDGNDEIRPYWVVPSEFWGLGSFTYRVEGFGAGTGTIVTRPSGRIHAFRRVVTFGRRAALGGGLSFSSCGPPATGPTVLPEYGVTVVARPFGRRDFNAVAATVTRGGFWNAYPRPRIETTYRMYYVDPWGGGGRSEDIVVQVRPRVALSLVGGLLVTHVEAVSSYAGERATMQRRLHTGWRTIATAALDRQSRAAFNLPGVRPDSRVRVAVFGARPGYVAGYSRTLTLG